MGWYPDPAGSAKERYWDGTRWTRNLRNPPEPPRSHRSHQNGLPESLEPIRRRHSAEEPRRKVVQRRSAHSAGSSNPAASSDPAGPADSGSYRGSGTPSQPDPGQIQPQSGNPYEAYRQPQRAASRTDTTTSDGVPLAGWWWRVLSTIIDQTIVWTLVAVLLRSQLNAYLEAAQRLAVQYGSVSRLLEVARTNPNAVVSAELTEALSTLVFAAIIFQAAYQFVMLALFSASVGQLISGLRVVEVGHGRQHRRLKPWRAGLRAAAWGLVAVLNSFIGMLTVVSYLLPLFQRRRQTIHDLVGGTQVIRLSRD